MTERQASRSICSAGKGLRRLMPPTLQARWGIAVLGVWALFAAAALILVATITVPVWFRSAPGVPGLDSRGQAIADYLLLAQSVLQSVAIGVSMALTIAALHGFDRRYRIALELIRKLLSRGTTNSYSWLERYVIEADLLRIENPQPPSGEPVVLTRRILTPDHMPKVLFGDYAVSMPVSDYLAAMREERDQARKLPAKLAAAVAGMFTANVLATVRLVAALG